MKATLLACPLLLLTVFFSPVKAQTDTTANMPVYSTLPDTAVYDLGRITMKKKFTQAITIHAADLEKMPFTDLKEAVTLYFNGVYGQQQKFAYVIDGVLNTDINAYSIYDIDEITIVQNAATTLNGITPLQVLVLVKTKRGGPNRKGIIAAGQVNQVRKYYGYNATTSGNSNNKGNSTQDLYQQYYISAYTNTKTIKAGLSADIQHNVFPQYWNKDIYETFKPLAGNRFKFNGYLDINLDDNNTLSINAGYVPQKDKESYIFNNAVRSGASDQRSISQNLGYGNIQFKSNIADLFTNNLSAGFQRRGYKSNWTILDPNAILTPKSTVIDSTTTINNLIVKDDFSYQGTLDDNEDFTFNANINALYRQTDDSAKYVTTRVTTFTNSNTVASLQKQRLFVITPSVTINYVDMVSLQVGAQKILNTNTPAFNGSNTPKILPFASLNVDILRTLGATDSVMLLRKLTLYGSYASGMSYAADFTGTLLEIPYYRGTFSVAGAGTPLLREPINPYQTYNQIQGGLTYSMFKKGLSFSYNYSNAKFNAIYYIEGTVSPQTDTARSTTANIVTHRLGINYTLPGNGKFKWTAGLNGAYITNKGFKNNYTLTQLRIFYPGKSLITAGFASQVSYNKAFAGVGLVYDMNRGVYHAPVGNGNGNYTVYNDMIQGLKLQNVYLGYRLKPLKMVRYLDVFINARNLYQQVQLIEGNIPRYSAEDKRFFGGGIKLEI
ncbi:hypothetical protein [Mucilaginibacter sp. UYCu711]|uniref:hypothetical protein n=1 Tax=Mucilaginibacter sp. UYCu711 TaxID=3156339 RepID=UPI003D20E928